VWKDDPDVVGKIVRNFNLSAMLNFLDEKNLSRTIASPSIRVLDGETANIAITDTVPIKEYKYIVASGDVTTGGGVEQGFEYKELEFGITLNITPFIHDDEVTLKFDLTKDRPGQSIEDELGKHWGKSGSSTTTIVRVKDGETVIMGGLVDKKRDEDKSTVPFFDKIPLIGDLLRKESVTDERNKEMIIFMTPYITGGEDLDLQEDLLSWGASNCHDAPR
jgi:type II secretory pathway component GspD/PulD (secretin)